MSANCELCAAPGGELLCQDAQLRVVLVDDQAYPGFCRVIWNAHVREMTDLSPDERSHLMQAVFMVEAAIRQVMSPDKINLASFGTMTPHLHWHVIPRYSDDAHYPAAIWAAAQREPERQSLAKRQALLPALRSMLVRQFSMLQE